MKTLTAHRSSFSTCWDRVSCVKIRIKLKWCAIVKTNDKFNYHCNRR